MEVKFLPVYKPNEAERKDATLYANNMQRLMASHLGMYFVCVQFVTTLTRHTHTHTQAAKSVMRPSKTTSLWKRHTKPYKGSDFESSSKTNARGRSVRLKSLESDRWCAFRSSPPRSVKIDLEKFDFEKGVVVDDDGEKKKDE